jgi:hypothetical protein
MERIGRWPLLVVLLILVLPVVGGMIATGIVRTTERRQRPP